MSLIGKSENKYQNDAKSIFNGSGASLHKNEAKVLSLFYNYFRTPLLSKVTDSLGEHEMLNLVIKAL